MAFYTLAKCYIYCKVPYIVVYTLAKCFIMQNAVCVFNVIYVILYISKMLYVANFENAIYGSQMLYVWLYDARTMEKKYSQCEIVN